MAESETFREPSSQLFRAKIRPALNANCHENVKRLAAETIAGWRRELQGWEPILARPPYPCVRS